MKGNIRYSRRGRDGNGVDSGRAEFYLYLCLFSKIILTSIEFCEFVSFIRLQIENKNYNYVMCNPIFGI